MADSRIRRAHRVALSVTSALAVVVAGGATAGAQAAKKPSRGQNGVSHSGMEQGEAVISVRSDVKLQMKGTRGATKAQVAAIGEAIRRKMPELKQCYGKLVSRDPTAAMGIYQLIISFEKNEKRPVLQYADTNRGHPKLQRCIQKTLGKASLRDADLPAAALLKLDFANTRARGQAAMERANDPLTSVRVETARDGSLSARWKTEDGKLAFRVTARSPAADRETVAVVLGGLRSAYGSFLDCRRRAGKRGASPAGETVTEVKLKARGRASAKNRSSTLELAPAAACIERIYRRLRFDGATARSRVSVTVIFSE